MDVEDLAGLNRTGIIDAPVVDHRATAEKVLRSASVKSLSLAGMRHSQGGQTTRAGGRMLLTETLRAVSYDASTQTVTAEAGATWSQIHHLLRPFRRALLVQQSSAHFTVGGSIAVNCHGRDPSQGPIGNVVQSMDVLCGDGQVRTCSRSQNPDLFRAVIGGMGACGMILSAELSTTEDIGLAEVWFRCTSLRGYIDDVLKHLPQRKGYSGSLAHLHYGWLCPVPGNEFLDEVVAVDYPRYEHPPGNPNQDPVALALNSPPRDETWGTSEVMRASWAAARVDPKVRKQLWDRLRYPSSKAIDTESFLMFFDSRRPIGERQSPDLRSNWMRASVAFTASRGHDGSDGRGHTDQLQEFFVPLHQGEAMVSALRASLQPNRAQGIQLLSCTLRLVQKDESGSLLNYAGQGPRLCIAMDLQMPVETLGGQRQPTPGACQVVSSWIDEAIGLGGSYYLPYYRFATRDQFVRCYGVGADALRRTIDRYDQERKFWNDFLEAYLG